MKRAEAQLNAAERIRQRSGAMARHTASQLGRKWLCIPLVMGSVVILAAPTANISSPLALLAIWAPFSLLVTSFATLAGEAAPAYSGNFGPEYSLGVPDSNSSFQSGLRGAG